jgi:hypothetical protein
MLQVWENLIYSTNRCFTLLWTNATTVSTHFFILLYWTDDFTLFFFSFILLKHPLNNVSKQINIFVHRFYNYFLLFFSYSTDCPNCVDDAPSRWTMPLTKLGEKRYYLGIFFKVNHTAFCVINYINIVFIF